MTRKILAVAFLAALTSPVLAADTWVVDKNHSQVRFEVRHLMSKVGGRFGDFAGTIVADAQAPAKSSVEFTVKSATINTDNENRDKHLKTPDFFDVEKFPEITFKSSKVAPKGKDQFDVTGTFTMHGVAKEVTLPVTFLGTIKDPGGREKAGFETSITLNRKDYGIVWNKNLDGGGVLLADDVVVNISLQAARPKPVDAMPVAPPPTK